MKFGIENWIMKCWYLNDHDYTLPWPLNLNSYDWRFQIRTPFENLQIFKWRSIFSGVIDHTEYIWCMIRTNEDGPHKTIKPFINLFKNLKILCDQFLFDYTYIFILMVLINLQFIKRKKLFNKKISVFHYRRKTKVYM